MSHDWSSKWNFIYKAHTSKAMIIYTQQNLHILDINAPDMVHILPHNKQLISIYTIYLHYIDHFMCNMEFHLSFSVNHKKNKQSARTLYNTHSRKRIRTLWYSYMNIHFSTFFLHRLNISISSFVVGWTLRVVGLSFLHVIPLLIFYSTIFLLFVFAKS